MSLKLDSLSERLTRWPVLTGIGIALTGASLSYYARRWRKRLPPGPTGYPLVGNALQMPTEEPWRVYNQWAEKYGDIIYLEALGQPIIVFNSMKTAQDLLVKRAATYSDRMYSPVDVLMDTHWSFPILKYGNLWRDHRRAFYSFFSAGQVSQYHPIIEEEVKLFLQRLSSNPEGFFSGTRSLFGDIIMRVSYGIRDREYIKDLVQRMEIYLRGYFEYASPGRLFVSSFPTLRHVPSWFPGAGWKRRLYALKDLGLSSIQQPWDDVKARVQSGECDRRYPDIASALVEGLPGTTDPTYDYRNMIGRDTAGISYVAGSDTTVSSATALYVALGANPAVQRTAQAEIDALTGVERLPTIADAEQMPYIQAIVKEMSRWHTVVPLSLPHQSMQDDIYEGYFIPAGTWFLPNSWAIMHDPNVFDSPMEFRPERYLKDGRIDPNVLDPEAAAFGYGRRICPGRHFSNAALTCMVASLMAVYDISPAEDEAGKPIPLELRTDSRILATPLPFQCKITPRSPHHEALLHLNTLLNRRLIFFVKTRTGFELCLWTSEEPAIEIPMPVVVLAWLGRAGQEISVTLQTETRLSLVLANFRQQYRYCCNSAVMSALAPLKSSLVLGLEGVVILS
ncbi:cytochrome P450 [Coprinopsis sp. MPI-PUGE-AT-0042]|nr:cytochrome P450 [Coprinopsis sp. MPI-PUGE-AT-0042]